MLRRLTALLFIHVIRVWVEQQAVSTPGWVAALRDQCISTALGLIHHSPEQRWTVEELASSVALSRSVFSARFTRLVGEPPITYLARWRMSKATRLLKDNVEIEKIAALLGYESAVAFHKALIRSSRSAGAPAEKSSASSLTQTMLGLIVISSPLCADAPRFAPVR